MFKTFWRIWCKALGEKISENQFEADCAALIRTFWWFVHIITCGFIIANAGQNLGLWWLTMNKEQLEALINDGKIERAIVIFADEYKIPASELAGFIDCILTATYK